MYLWNEMSNILLAVGYLQGLCTDIACRTGLIFLRFSVEWREAPSGA